MLIIKKEILKNIGYYNLELQIINLASGYGNSNISLTPIWGMLNNYKEERRKMIRMVKEKERIAKLNFE
ncbi:TPA: hypothetical protein O9691_001523 [Staphylococcus aureus]|uniref:hypothetical protein n=1 Tax=Staphylococcus aureus TaxID=1280 RepID=UPI0002477B8C|nr:hypothetical protein [Staphylococcus aureus]EHO88826.1 hypothetical protein SA21262_0645 [Staphylococcus aureus subsp. aureus 21262]MBH4802527.1 hypothetical protein [Staphylococcus aureus]MBH4809886.1 hypothetical protein [Staphylococcus aureus]MBH4852130.1 hypothetical protein [Staphylococcus aureus]MBH4880812.1 hypothetical protein [Staphylococcus aureus]